MSKRKSTESGSGQPVELKRQKTDEKSPGKSSSDVGGTATSKVKSSKYVFFFGMSEVFSQFHPAKFTVDGQKYNCMEQYMHHQKAVTFKDTVRAREILATTDPKLQKKLGRQVENFDKDVWSRESVKVVEKGSEHKYLQNEDMKKVLFATYPKTLVEASPRDRLWGIGMGASNPKAQDRSQWRGKNLLGDTLTRVRNRLMKKEGLISEEAKAEEIPDKPEESEDSGTAASSVKSDKFVFYYGMKDVFSQFHPAKFTVDGQEYNCTEQYMQHQKAVIFKDTVRAKEILSESGPRRQNELGRRVENFDKDVWNRESVKIVEKGNEQKYLQNKDMKKALFDTYPKTLVEASARDRVWGIGMGASNPEAQDQTKWRGKNLLGHALTRVRNKLMKKEGLISEETPGKAKGK